MRIVERYPLWLRALRGGRGWLLLLPVRAGLALLYGTAIALRGIRRSPGRCGAGARTGASGPRGAGAREPRVISIGNLEVGGGGKTPCALFLAAAIAKRGGTAVIVTRGYRSEAARHAPFIVPSGRALAGAPPAGCTLEHELAGKPLTPGAARYLGDEVSLYRERGIPVVIDPDRARGIDFALRAFEPSHIVLDDAFQHRRARRDLDILLLDAARPFGNGILAPLGTLREPPRAARRADVLVLTRADEARDADDGSSVDTVRRMAGRKPVFAARHRARDFLAADGSMRPLSDLPRNPVTFFSGIARPESFERLAARIGIEAALAFRFPDHHAYEPGDVERMATLAGAGAAFVTTEKDWAKVRGLFPAGIDLRALRIEMEIERADELLALVDPPTASSGS